MSKFLTSIPIDTTAITSLLPKRSAVLGVRLNFELSRVEVEWDADDYMTPWTFAAEFPFDVLSAGKVPDTVKVRPGAELLVMATSIEPVDSKKGKRVKEA